MADLNNTIVRGKLRVTEDINANGSITGSSATLSSVKNAGILGTDSSGKVHDNSSKYQKAGDYVTYDNASKDIYLGSYGIHSGTRPSSDGLTLMGNGYWIKPSSVGVSSKVIGGTTASESAEMTPDCVSIGNGKIKLNTSGIVSDGETFTFDGNPGSVATSADLKNYQKKGNYVTTDTAQTITGRKTFNSPANVNGQEVTTAIFKTSNGGQLIIGKEGPNSGTMLRFDQTAGTTRLQFRASATPGAMVWTQPEKGAALYFDLTNSAGASTRTTLDARSGTIARTSDIKNKKITIQKNGTEVGSFTTNPSSDKTINLTIAKSDVGLGNVDNTADKDKSVKYASSAGDASNAFKLVSEDKQIEYDWITIHNIFDRISYLERYTKVYSVDTNTTISNNHGTPINSRFESNVETLSVEMSTNFDSYPRNQCIYADRVGDITPNELKVGDIIVIDGYLSRYVSDKTTVTTHPSGEASIIRVKFTAINKQYLDRINGKANVGHTHAISDITNLQSTLNGKVNSDDLLKITGSSGFGDANWHYRKIGHFIFNSSDTRNGAPVHLSGVIGDWTQGKMIFDIFVSTRGGLTVNGFVRGANPSCRLVIDNTENPNIFLAVKGFATYNVTVNTFENAKNENNAVRGSFHIDWTGGDDFTGSDVGVTATNFAYKDLLSMVAYQRAYCRYTGAFAETSGTMTKLCEVKGEETGKIICVHGKATSANSELSIQRKTSHYYDYDCIAVAPTGYQSGTYISCTGVVPPRVQYSTTSDTPSESTYYIFGKNVSEVYVITFDLP